MSDKVWWIIVAVLAIFVLAMAGAVGYVFLNPPQVTPELPPLPIQQNITPPASPPTPTWNPALETTQFPQIPVTPAGSQ